ncbi:hypothetical protein MAR_023854 [Mya arenaria]|uniref:Prolyl 4-hydroxylase alpha subunit domain-containing protein n=1 Tax=Mya arenaria TaxID=6604 RepID=A0ABY7DP53_MYAAR|nr:hypothetical protein MAR_023854 [Mya arenaria]
MENMAAADVKSISNEVDGLNLNDNENANETGALNDKEEPQTKGGRLPIVREDVNLPNDFKEKLAFVLYNVLTKEECEDYIKRTEKMGYEDALVNVGGGRQKKMTDVRNNTRCIWDTTEEADRIWQRIKEHVPKEFQKRKVLGLNERLRFLKYKPGEYFKPHQDGSYFRENGEKSFGFQGGSTTFMNFNLKNPVEVVPKTGSILVFQHDIMHEGSLLKKGKKYTMRTDVMYSATKGS